MPNWALQPGKHPYFLPAPNVGFSGAGEFAEAQEESGESTEPGVPGEGPEEPPAEIGGSKQLGLRCGTSYCAVPPLRYLGGLVQHQPNVHLVFWGSNWQTGANLEAQIQIRKMFEGLSSSAYQGILTQYFDTTGRVSSTINLSYTVDTRVAAPAGVGDEAIQGEVAWAANLWSREPNAQFMVLTAPGSTYESGFGHFCAYHDIDPQGGIYSIVPWAGDPPFGTTSNCASYYGSGSAANATSVMASHEYAESATDPRWDTSPGWKSLDGNEVTDICATPGDTLASGAVVQGQYDDHQNGCSLSDAQPPHVLALSDNPSNVTRHGGTIHATINPEGLPTTYRLEYGTTSAYGTTIPASGESSAGSGFGNVEAEATLSALTLGQTYHYRVAATNSSGTTYGEDRTFMPSNWLIRQNPPEPARSTDWLDDVSCPSEAFCMAVGYYYNEAERPLAFKKVGHTWSSASAIPMPSGARSLELNGVSCVAADACTAVGEVWKPAVSEEWLPVVMRWNGANWSEQALAFPAGSTGILTKVSCVSRTECMAVGRILSAEQNRNISALWRNGGWTILTTPTAAESTGAKLEGVSCGAAQSCVAVGWYNTGHGSKPTLISWNGSSWSTMTAANNELGRYGISCLSSMQCTAVGVGNRIETWNGTAWTNVPGAPLTDVTGATLFSVSCISASDCTAVGGADSQLNARNLTIAERWNGTSWSVESTPRPSERARNEFTGVSCLPLECTAVGFSLASGATRSLIEARRMPDLSATFISSIGSSGTERGQLSRPWGLDVDANGNVWVADKTNNRVEEFNAKGEFVLMFGKEVDKTTKGNVCLASSSDTCGAGVAGPGPGQFNEPLDIAVTSGGELWVTDGVNNRVEKFNSQGTYLAQFGSSGNGNGQFTEPWGIDVAPDGTIWVVDARYYRVEQFTAAGSWIRTVQGAGQGGSGPGEFAGPRGLAVDSEGHVWVTDRGNNRVTELSATGQYLSQFGSAGTGEGQFGEPQAITVTPSGDLLVADRSSGRIEEFSPDGDFEAQIGGFSEPRGVAVGPSGLLYVSDTLPSVIRKWQLTSKPEVSTISASGIGPTGATLRGTVNPGGLASSYYFEYGTTTEYGARVPVGSGSAGSSHETSQITAVVSGLKPETTYHYRLVVSNVDGISRGADVTFTSEPPFVTPSMNPAMQRNWGTGALPGRKLVGTREVTMSLAGGNLMYQTTLAGTPIEWSASGIECSNCKIENRAGTGANTGKTEAVFSGTPKLTGVKSIAPANCVMPSTLTLQPLTGVLGGRPGSPTLAAASLSPTSGTTWASYELTGCPLAGVYKWTGTAFGRFTNALGVAAKNQQFSLSQANQEEFGKYSSLNSGEYAVFLTGSINLVAEEEYEVKEEFPPSGTNLFTTPSTSPLIPRNWYTGTAPGTKLAGTQAVQTALASEKLNFSTTVAGIATKFTASGLECSGCKIENRAGTGENVANTEAVFTGELTFTGAKMLSPSSCSMASTLKSKPLVGVVGGEKGSATKAAIRLSPKEGTNWVTIELAGEKCPIAGLYKFSGTEFGEFANPLGMSSKNQIFRLSQTIQESLGSATSMKFGENATIVNGEVNLTSEAEFQVKEK